MKLYKKGKFWTVKKEGRVVFMSIDFAQAIEKAMKGKLVDSASAK